MKLREIAHSRTGDKGNTANISVIARDTKKYPALVKYLTSERVKEHFSEIVEGKVAGVEENGRDPGIATTAAVVQEWEEGIRNNPAGWAER